ncbi:helix-turn-helix domain-containing protein [Luoshenia tenuis]|uniref:helix-turn-helix domain-containing protein n=1 Tax=Luoshenia tenuis TaxID=2763654 RepID=UPI003D8A516C
MVERLTLDKLCALPELSGLKRATPEVFYGTNVSEIFVLEHEEAINWIPKDGFVLTSESFIREGKMQSDNFIAALKSNGCTGLGIKVGCELKKLPPALIKAATQQQLPLVKIPHYYSFGQIMRVEREQSLRFALNRMEQMQRAISRLSGLYFSRAGMERLLKEIAQTLGTAIFLTDTDFTVLVRRIFGGEKWLECQEKLQLLTEANTQLYQLNDTNGNYRQFMLGERTARFYVQAVPDANIYLCIFTGNNDLEQEQRLYVQRAADILSLEWSRSGGIERSKEVHEFFREFLKTASEKSEYEVISRCAQYGFDYKRKRVCLTFMPQDLDADVWNTTDAQEAIVQLIKSDAKDCLSYICSGSNRMTVFLLFSNRISSTMAVAAAQRIGKRYLLQQRACGLLLCAGVSRCYQRTGAIGAAYCESIKAIQLERDLGWKPEMALYRDGMIYHLLRQLSRQELENICQDQIQSLADYDKTCGSALIQTLKTYFECHFNLSACAAKLSIHRNTMRQRMEKIESLLQADLEAAANGYALYASLCAWELLAGEEKEKGMHPLQKEA